ncbi:bifunctional fructose-bisphosphatase/inositol-phosphate phosphatase [Methanolobus sp.]|jgi:myo-inositol-1(or 4)-monophosphatase|uniref:bifunctional fructose-bisphosphatase/inositol-phosphate phosphatase n=1 Tax=Methanolobus sp. TaxID=1874737 RepID=UPI0025DFD550|nr:bifunctional fructose-bisphosphatase/inositol-phosphate phosphatase [Methanolobus sp.]
MQCTGNFLDLSERIADAVHEATKELVGTPDAGRTLYMGADGTPTKLIDDVAEKAVFDLLEKEHRPFRVISEEAGEKIFGNSPDLSIILDPIDGTYNASQGIPFYSLSLAITTTDLNDIRFGYVKNLATGDTFHAEVGKGAYLNGKRLETSKNSDVSKFCVSIYGYKRDIKGAANISESVRRIRALGSVALELCYVAAGMIDALADVRGTMRMTDIAAGKLIVEEAGGIVTNGYGEALKLEYQVISRVSVIASNGLAHDRILKLSTGIVHEDK